MFASEVCIYYDEQYFHSQIGAMHNAYPTAAVITDRSLAQSWGLSIPTGFREWGVHWRERDDDDQEVVFENWLYGEAETGR